MNEYEYEIDKLIIRLEKEMSKRSFYSTDSAHLKWVLNGETGRIFIKEDDCHLLSYDLPTKVKWLFELESLFKYALEFTLECHQERNPLVIVNEKLENLYQVTDSNAFNK